MHVFPWNNEYTSREMENTQFEKAMECSYKFCPLEYILRY